MSDFLLRCSRFEQHLCMECGAPERNRSESPDGRFEHSYCIEHTPTWLWHHVIWKYDKIISESNKKDEWIINVTDAWKKFNDPLTKSASSWTRFINIISNPPIE